jgi:hypothetical protein
MGKQSQSDHNRLVHTLRSYPPEARSNAKHTWLQGPLPPEVYAETKRRLAAVGLTPSA